MNLFSSSNALQLLVVILKLCICYSFVRSYLTTFDTFGIKIEKNTNSVQQPLKTYYKTIFNTPGETHQVKYNCNGPLKAVPNVLASAISGSLAGAIGFGIAFPLDTLKTKAQVMGVTSTPSNFVTISGEMFENAASVKKPPSNLNFIQLSQFIYQTEGAAGFFRGALPMIFGKALIKAVSFSSNNFALFMLQTFPPVSESVLVQQYLPPSSPLQLFVAACFAGFISSFTVNPIERIKVLMQASSYTIGSNEFFALQLTMEVLKVEGWKGLLGRGLGTTIAREVPAVTINFFIYELLSDTYIAKDVLGPFLSPIIFGALSGMACWISIYPIDTVKTILQNSNGHDEQSNIFLLITSIYRKGGMPAFFHGLTPILLRASLNHAATFSIYEMLMHALSPGL